jgi:Thioredoxin
MGAPAWSGRPCRLESPERSFRYGGGAALLAICLLAVLIIVSQSGGGSGGDTNIAGVATVEQQLKGIPQHATVLGKPNAKATIVKFGDLQCPTCQAFSTQSTPKLISDIVRTGPRTTSSVSTRSSAPNRPTRRKRRMRPASGTRTARARGGTRCCRGRRQRHGNWVQRNTIGPRRGAGRQEALHRQYGPVGRSDRGCDQICRIACAARSERGRTGDLAPVLL